MRPRLPPELVADISAVPEQLLEAAQQRGLPPELLEPLVRALPDGVRGAPCFLDPLTGLWRYEYGEPIALERGRVVVGTQMFPPINTLLEALVVVSQRLDPDQMRVYMGRLADRGRHQDVLAEMAPLRDVPLDVPVQFEVPAVGGTTIDWAIRPDGEPITLLDVKNRILDIIGQLGSMPPDAEEVPAPAHDHGRMIRGVQHKFEPVDPTERQQGVWVTTILAQREDLISAAFDLLDADRVHFLVLNNTHREGLIISRSGVDKGRLYRLFGIAERPDLVFRAEDEGGRMNCV